MAFFTSGFAAVTLVVHIYWERRLDSVFCVVIHINSLCLVGHIGIGGQVGENVDMYSSPGDPLFCFVHAAMDKIWDKWQRASWETRKSDYPGPDTMFAYPFNFFGDIPYTNITLNYPLHYDNFSDDVLIKDVMDTAAPNLYYKYV